jgi:hypothetical protein
MIGRGAEAREFMSAIWQIIAANSVAQVDLW